jgi:3-deoxy-D-arabino-heptulosonate 7-phosphate (DAHP) synthase
LEYDLLQRLVLVVAAVAAAAVGVAVAVHSHPRSVLLQRVAIEALAQLRRRCTSS